MPKHLNPFRAARLLTGLSQQDASKRAKLAQTNISDLETGTNVRPSWETIGRLAVLYGCSPFDLLPLTFRPRPAPRRLFLGSKGVSR